MEYTVIKPFIDRDSLKQFNAGDKFPCVDTERAGTLITKGYISDVVEAPEVKPVEDKPAKPQKSTKAKAAGKAGNKKKA